LTLEEPEEIPSEREGFETAGLMDRARRRIVAAQKYPREWRRFTIAHEIAHWVLHPNVEYHRDRPLTGGERANTSRPLEEQEADRFAAELLMPTRVLTEYFNLAFDGPIDCTIPTSNLASRLSGLTNQNITVEDLSRDLRVRALLIARSPVVRLGQYF